LLVAATAAGACKKKNADSGDQPAGSGSDSGSGSAEPQAGSGSGSGSGSAEGSGSGSAAAPLPPKATRIGEYFKTPESVYPDTGRDSYLVSNINGTPFATDDNGYLVVLNPDGSGNKWIDGAADDIKLDAPKGVAISGDVLYVADITVVRRFQARDGKQLDDVKIDGASFLNDVAADGKGGVYVTDTGVDDKFAPNGTDAVYHVDKAGKVATVIKDKDLGGPNGVWPGDGGAVWVVTFRSGELFSVDAKGKKGAAEKLPKGQLDGVVAIGGGELLISSWEGKAVYRGKPGGPWTEVVKDVAAPADIGWDAKRKQVLIPEFQGDSVMIVPLE
jgi:sugar lactone lactonase YvrE